jgi:hypothetical protein
MEEMTGKSQTLAEFYQSLDINKVVPPKKAFLVDAARQCEVEPQTISLWARGKARPSKKEHYDILSEMTGIPKDQLFANDSHAEC